MINFSSELILWYKQHQRSLPWRETKDPYFIWISEIILQQTRVVQGLSYYLKFVDAYPKVNNLANASEDEVLKLWEGLGYYSRARNMHNAAKYVVDKLNGNFPSSYKELLKLKGVGPYTAAAVSSICANEHQTVVDGNVYRVLSRLYNIDTPINSTKGIKQFAALAHELNDARDHGIFNQALMEFGAMQCTPKKTECKQCIFSAHCLALQNGNVAKLPVKEKKLKIKKRYLNFILLKNANNQVLIKRRDGNDVWKGLYQFPLIETSKSVEIQYVLNIGDENKWFGKNVIIKNQQTLTHKLTHQTLHINIYQIELSDLPKIEGYSICLYDNLRDFAFPKPLVQFLDY